MDHLGRGDVAMPPGACPQVLRDREALPVEVGQQEHRDAGGPSASTRRSSASTLWPFISHDREVVAAAEIDLPEDVGDAALLDDQAGAKAIVRPGGVGLPVADLDIGVGEVEAVGPAERGRRRPRRSRARPGDACAARSARRAACRARASRR